MKSDEFCAPARELWVALCERFGLYPTVHNRRFRLGGLLLAVLSVVVALGATAVAAPGNGEGPPPWAPGPGGPDVVHVMHGNPNQQSGSTSPELAYRGGAVQTMPAAYLVYWGSQWGNDPAGEATYLSSFLSGLNGSADTWSTSTTQYCQGVATGTTDCSKAATTNTTMISHPASGNLLGTWSDNATAAPTRPKQSQLAAEAVRAAKNFGVVPGAKVQIVVATAHNNNATGFGTSYCAWHSSTSYNGSYLAYTNLPYIPDAGGACGANFVNQSGLLDGVSIVEGHEYAESVTDPFPNNGWLDANGAENGDKCAWISSGQGAATDVTIASGTFPVQSLWSNNFNGTGGCVTFYQDASNQH